MTIVVVATLVEVRPVVVEVVVTVLVVTAGDGETVVVTTKVEVVVHVAIVVYLVVGRPFSAGAFLLVKHTVETAGFQGLDGGTDGLQNAGNPDA